MAAVEGKVCEDTVAVGRGLQQEAPAAGWTSATRDSRDPKTTDSNRRKARRGAVPSKKNLRLASWPS